MKCHFIPLSEMSCTAWHCHRRCSTASAAVDAHRDDAVLQHKAWEAVAAITAGADRKMQNSFATAIGAAIAAMGARGDDAAVQEQACAVVANLTESDEESSDEE